eukprot:scaffold42699_cov33-Tisochrysis_lutea.AAC.2
MRVDTLPAPLGGGGKRWHCLDRLTLCSILAVPIRAVPTWHSCARPCCSRASVSSCSSLVACSHSHPGTTTNLEVASVANWLGVSGCTCQPATAAVYAPNTVSQAIGAPTASFSPNPSLPREVARTDAAVTVSKGDAEGRGQRRP